MAASPARILAREIEELERATCRTPEDFFVLISPRASTPHFATDIAELIGERELKPSFSRNRHISSNEARYDASYRLLYLLALDIASPISEKRLEIDHRVKFDEIITRLVEVEVDAPGRVTMRMFSIDEERLDVDMKLSADTHDSLFHIDDGLYDVAVLLVRERTQLT